MSKPTAVAKASDFSEVAEDSQQDADSGEADYGLRPKVAQKPCMIWSLGPKALKYESLEPWDSLGMYMHLVQGCSYRPVLGMLHTLGMYWVTE